MKIAYISRRFSAASEALIGQANTIIEEYQAQGFVLTLRQLYYQFVARDLIANTPKSYKRFQGTMSDARKAGHIDWRAIEDRTRIPVEMAHWSSPTEILESAASGYRIDKWATQLERVEVWIEKDALVGVIEKVCRELDVTYFSCRGYSSDPPVWDAAQRFRRYNDDSQRVTVLHLGDHDPSGIDMTRDIQDRLSLYGARVEVKRIALTMEQVRQYDPPPNPAKISDSRYDAYCSEYGDESWELDALDPAVIALLIHDHVVEIRDGDLWVDAVAAEEKDRKILGRMADEYPDIAEYLRL